MSIRVEIIEDDLVLFPSNTVERYGLEKWISGITMVDVGRIVIDDEYILEREYEKGR